MNTQHKPFDAIAQVRDLRCHADPRQARLVAALLDMHNRLEALHDGVATQGHAPILERCNQLLLAARAAMGGCKDYMAWDCIQQIDRELIATLNYDGARRVQWQSLLSEAEQKLRGWRKKAVDLIRTREAQREVPSNAAMLAVTRHLHAEAQNRYMKLAMLNRFVIMLTTAIVVVVLVTVVAAAFHVFDWLRVGPSHVSFLTILLGGLVAGAAASVLSVALVTIKPDLTQDIPATLGSQAVTVLRLSVGPAVALPIVLLGSSGLLNLKDENNAIILSLCFLGGFSERWFLEKIQMLADRASAR